MKKSTFYLLALLALLGLGACAGCKPAAEGESNPNVSAQDEEMVEISLLPEDSSLPEEVNETEETEKTEKTRENATVVSSAKPVQKVRTPKNVILLIADGAGFGSFYCAADFETGTPTGLPYQQKPWVFVSAATFHSKSFYDPARDWADFKNGYVPFYEKSPEFIPPDSASTGTELNTGVKTRNGRINFGPNDERLTTLAEDAKRAGLSTGAVTTLQIASATPAAVAAHRVERKEGQAMFDEMLTSGVLDVLIGAGHPEYANDGTPRAPVFGKYGPSPATWQNIRSGKLPDGMVFVETRDDFLKIASGDVPSPRKLLGIPRVPNSFQFDRPQDAPFLPGIPTLAECTQAALQVVSKNENGFFLMVEGGAVDAANDVQNLPRLFEEMQDFNAAVACVCRWVEEHSSWEDTLVIVTSDHDNGAIYGPELLADGTPASAPVFHGKGNLPEAVYHASDHTKQLVPVYARGPGADFLRSPANFVGTDEKMGKLWGFDGKFIDQTTLYFGMKRTLLNDATAHENRP